MREYSNTSLGCKAYLAWFAIDWDFFAIEAFWKRNDIGGFSKTFAFYTVNNEI